MSSAAGSKPTIEDSSLPAGSGSALIVAAAPVVGEEIVGRVREALGDSRPRLFVVAPSLTHSALEHAMGSVDEARVEAEERLKASLTALNDSSFEATGTVGDSDPLLAIEDALRERGAETIVVVTSADHAHWLEDDLFERARQRFEAPIVHLEVEGPADHQHVAAVERKGRGAEAAPDAEWDPDSENLPRFSVRDLIGIAVAIIGSLVAIVIAAGCDNGENLQRTTASAGEGTDGSCVAAYIIAGLVTLVNVAHIVGLVLFEGSGYRGGWERFFSWVSLIGTPIAVLAVVLLAA